MSKVKPLLPGPVAVARRVLDECDVRHPRDICVEAIAARYGAMTMYGPVSTACAMIVRTSRRAVILVDERLWGQPRADFTIGHDLAHHLLHDVIDHFAQCEGEDARPSRDEDGRRRVVEKEADHFSTELKMPERFAAPLCLAPRPTLDDVHRVARTLGASFHASALRFIEMAPAPCAFVHTVGGKIKRSTETSAFPGTIVQRRPVHEHSVAAALQGRRAGADGLPREVPGSAWGDVGGPGFVEHAIALGPDLGVMSWIVPLG